MALTKAHNRMIEGATVSIVDFGGIPTTPSTYLTIDNAPALQAAVNHVAALGGGTVFVPAGYWGIGSTITIPNTSVAIAIVGENKSTRSVVRTQSNIVAFSLGSNTYGTQFRDIVVAGANSGTQPVVSATSSFLLSFQNVFFEKGTYGLSLGNCNDVDVVGCSFESPNGIAMSGTTTNTTISACTFNCLASAIRSTGAGEGRVVTGCTLRYSGTSTGPLAESLGTFGITLTGCYFKGDGVTAYTLCNVQNGSGTVVSGCQFYNAYRGVNIDTAAKNTVVSGCYFEDITNAGVSVSFGSAGNNNVVSACTFENCALNTTAPNNVQLFVITNDGPVINAPQFDRATLQQDGATINGVTTNGITLADDAATSRALQSTRGFALISSNAAIYALVFLNFDTIVDISSSATFDVNATNGTLSGTTGTDGRATIRMDNGTLYIENRLGTSRYFNVLLLANINS